MSTCVVYMVWFQYRVYFRICTNTKFASDSIHTYSKKLAAGQRTRLTLMRLQGRGFQLFRNSHSRTSDKRYSQGRTMLFAQMRQATKAAAKAELSGIIRHLAFRRQAHVFPACTSMWQLEKSSKSIQPCPEQSDRLRRPCSMLTLPE